MARFGMDVGTVSVFWVKRPDVDLKSSFFLKILQWNPKTAQTWVFEGFSNCSRNVPKTPENCERFKPHLRTFRACLRTFRAFFRTFRTELFERRNNCNSGGLALEALAVPGWSNHARHGFSGLRRQSLEWLDKYRFD